MKALPYSVHIALSTYPQKGIKEYKNFLREFYSSYQDSFKSRTNEIDEFLYEPLTYHLFGAYDVAAISFIDTFNFAQKLFFPTNEKIKTVSGNGGIKPLRLYPIYFQIYTGILHDYSDIMDLKVWFKKKKEKQPTFTAICNIKINNGLLIGNGNLILYPIMLFLEHVIENKLRSHDFVLIQSFNWAEISLILFTDEKIEKLAEVVQIIRELTLFELERYDLLNNHKGISRTAINKMKNVLNTSLYKKMAAEKEINSKGIHLFVDTHTHFGVRFDSIIPFNGNNVAVINENLLPEYTIETQIKPGHLEKFDHSLKRSGFNANLKFISGTSDYSMELENKCDLLEFSRYLKSEYLNENEMETSKVLKKQTRRFKTKLKFPTPPKKSQLDVSDLKVSSYLNNQVYTVEQIAEIKNSLRKLKISRSLRERVIKVFYNYNNGIQDPILYNLYIDFNGFLSYLENFVIKSAEENDNLFESGRYDNSFIYRVSKIESKLEKILLIFDDSFSYRFLNNGNFENLNEFNLGFNCSLQQLLTAFDNIGKEIAKSFFYAPGLPLTTINEITTKSNIVSINYNLFHLLEPGNVFSLLAKELLNQLLVNKEDFIDNKELPQIYSLLNQYSEVSKYLIFHLKSFLIERNLPNLPEFDFNYLGEDGIRFIYTFNCNWELYYYWFWHSAMQNSSFYLTTGSMSFEDFVLQLFRLMLFYSVFISEDSTNWDEKYFEIPIPELTDHWEKSWQLHKNIICEFCEKNSQKIELFKEITSILGAYIINNDINLEDSINIIGDKRTPKSSGYKTIHRMIYEPKSVAIKDFDWRSDFHDTVHEKFSMRYHGVNSKGLEIKNLFNKIVEENRDIPSEEDRSGVLIYDSMNYISPSFYYNTLAYGYLSWMYERNGENIKFLRREARTGEILNEFNMDLDHYVYIDPMGGHYSNNEANRNSYMQIRNMVLDALIHLGYVIKKGLFNDKQTRIENEK